MNSLDGLSPGTVDVANHLHGSLLKLLRAMSANRPSNDLTSSKLRVLARLQRHGAETATELAGYLHVQPQSLTRLLSDLERRELIARTQSTADRRQNQIRLTGEGARVLASEIADQRVRLARILAKELTPVEQELLRIAAGLIDQVSAVADQVSAVADGVSAVADGVDCGFRPSRQEEDNNGDSE